MPIPRLVRLSCELLLALLVSTGAASMCTAQAAVFQGTSVERFQGVGRLTVVSFRRTNLAAVGYGSDIALGFAPDYLGIRTLLLDLDAGFAYSVPVGPAKLLLKGGGTALVGIGALRDIYPGLQAGVAAIVPLEQRCALRLDLGRRVYLVPGDDVYRFWSVGIGLTVSRPH